MPSFDQLLQQGSAHAWLFVPAAIVLGALHGLEPGHSKTMMAAFIVAIRGTVAQAVLLGLAAAFSHSLVIWLLAAVALYYGSQWDVEAIEPYIQMGSGVIIMGLAVWMLWRTRRGQIAETAHAHHHHHHDHEGQHVSGEDCQDAHERAHAADIARRFANRHVTTGQIVVFGLTGGLLPCPAALTVLLVCLQLKRFVLGLALVLSFSFGLALTMVASGALAAWGVRHASRKFKGFNELARKAPYLSSLLLVCLGIYMGLQGWLHLH